VKSSTPPVNPNPGEVFDAARDSAALPGASFSEMGHVTDALLADFTGHALAATSYQRDTDRWPPSDPPAGDARCYPEEGCIRCRHPEGLK
jgi:hypothetical protein